MKNIIGGLVDKIDDRIERSHQTTAQNNKSIKNRTLNILKQQKIKINKRTNYYRIYKLD